jgi:hypothetical protein
MNDLVSDDQAVRGHECLSLLGEITLQYGGKKHGT